MSDSGEGKKFISNADLSRIKFGDFIPKDEYEKFSERSVKIGCLQRIADALETESYGPAHYRDKLKREEYDSTYYRDEFRQQRVINTRINRNIKSLREKNKKLKEEIKELKKLNSSTNSEKETS